jgi:hypothetical protein
MANFSEAIFFAYALRPLLYSSALDLYGIPTAFAD